MIAEIQKFEDAARMAMGSFEAPRPMRRQTGVISSLDRPLIWAIMSLAVIAVAAAALS